MYCEDGVIPYVVMNNNTFAHKMQAFFKDFIHMSCYTSVTINKLLTQHVQIAHICSVFACHIAITF